MILFKGIILKTWRLMRRFGFGIENRDYMVGDAE
jgi:hypothetical protein